MASIKRGALVAFTLLIVVIVSACNQPYSQQSSATSTPIDPNSLFATPMQQTPSMGDVEVFGTGTALALQTGTPLSGLNTQAPTAIVGSTQDLFITTTPTPLLSLNPTSTLAAGSTPSGPLPTSAPVGVRPASYTLQRGEFPYCIARRFDVNPDELLSLNGLSDGSIYYPNLSLRIPQSGSFPGTRALRNHPATYTVTGSDQTIYGIACIFGDVDPAAIAQANNISPSAALTSGQALSIP